MNWRWLNRRLVDAIHLRLLQRHGGAHGIRDAALLESALARPQNLAAYGEPTVFDLAASVAFGIARNHPFIDGNKRTAFLASVLFLRMNGQEFNAEQAEAALIFLRLAAGELSETELAEWLRQNSSPSAGPSVVPEQDQ